MPRRVLLAALFGAMPLAATAEPAPPIVLPTVDLNPLGGRETWPIAPGQVRRHQIDLMPGEFVRGTLVQNGVDVLVRRVSAELVPEVVDVSEGGRGREPVSLLAVTPGRYVLEVEAPAPGRGPASYQLIYEPVRIADARDLEWAAVEHTIALGGSSLGGRIADTRRARPDRSQVVTSLALFEEVLPFAQAHGETCWEAEISSHLLMTRPWVPRNDVEYGPLLDLWQACGDDARFVETLLWAARWEQTQGRYSDAASIFDLGLRLVRERADDPYLELQMLVGLANVRGLEGDGPTSIALLEEALPRLGALRLPAGEAAAYEGLGRAYLRQGDLQRAAERIADSVRIKMEIGDEWNAQFALLLLGEIHERQGDPELALSDYDRAAEIGGSFTPEARSLGQAAAANVLRQLGRRAEAIARLTDLFAKFKVIPDLFRSPTWPHVALSELYVEERRWDDARRQVDAALALAERRGDRYEWAQALDLRGRILFESGDGASARADFDRALALRRAIGDRIGEAASLHGLARVEREAGEAAAALARLVEARTIVRSQRAVLASPAVRATWIATVRRIDEDYIDLVMGSAEPEVANAFDASEGAHARALLDMLGESRAGIAEGADQELLDAERAARRQLAERLDQQMRAAAGADEALKAEVKALAAEHERLRAELRTRHPRYVAFADPSPVALQALQDALLDADTTLVEYFLGRERGHAFVVTKDSVHAFELAGRARIDGAVSAMRGALGSPAARHRRATAEAALREVSRLVWEPIAGAVSGRRVVVMPDGPLHHVPFGALAGTDGRVLVDRFEVVTAPSASVVAFQRQGAPSRMATRDVAVLADPVYDVADERVGARPAGEARPRNTALKRVTRDFGFRDGHLPRLAFTRREARAIMEVAPPGRSKAFLDFAASLASVRDPDLASYRYLHFATHGLLNDARPELSGIVLSLVDRDGRDQLGLLTAPDVLELRLGADLVVLSSCRSALGREVNGEGMLGLTGAFMYAGVPRVIASLWPVDDLATAELMRRFYRGLLGPDHLSAAAALRAAQRDLRRQPQWRHPFYWAGFQLQGDWR